MITTAGLLAVKTNEYAMKSLPLLALLVLAACSSPMLSADLTFGDGGVSVNPTLSGEIGKANVSVQP